MGSIKKLTSGLLNVIGEPIRMLTGTDDTAEIAARQAAAERAQYAMQQRQLEQANALESSKVLDSVVKIETGAGTDVVGDSTALGVKKKKASTSTSLGVV